MKINAFTAIITGSDRGIGRATALMLAEKGCNIVVNYRKRKIEAEKTKKLIEKFGVKVIIAQADIRKLKDVKKLVKITITEFGRIDFLVNNAGVAAYEDFSEMMQEKIDEIIDVNLKGLLYCTKEVLPIMIKQKAGKIINISSGLGKYGMAGFAVYCATKFGVIGFTEALAEEVKKFNIGVYAVCPGGVNTEMHWSLLPDEKPELEPEDVAKVIVKICESYSLSESGKAIDV